MAVDQASLKWLSMMGPKVGMQRKFPAPKEPSNVAAQRQVPETESDMPNDKLLKSAYKIDETALALSGLREVYADLYDFAPVGYATIDSDSRILQGNITAAGLLGLSRGELIGRRLADFIHPVDREKFDIYLVGILAGSQIALCQLKIMQATGTARYVQMQSVCHRPSEQAGPEIWVALFDISDQQLMLRRASLIHRCLEISHEVDEIQDLLQTYVAEIKTFLGCDALGIRVLDDEGRVSYRAYEGFDCGFCKSENLAAIESNGCICCHVIKGETDPNLPFFTTGGSFFINTATRFLIGLTPAQRATAGNFCSQCGYESVVLVPMSIEGKKIVGLIHGAHRQENMFPPEVVRILEELAMHLSMCMQRISAQKNLEKSHEELRFFSTQLLTAQENEQRRIAMGLHDGLGQDLNVLKLRLASIHSRLPQDPPSLQEDSRLVLRQIDGIISDVRRLAQGMSPTLLEDLGLSAALSWLIRNFSLGSGIKVSVKPIHIDSYLRQENQIILYRIVQEALTNVAKHARATAVFMSFRKNKGCLRIIIQDDGQGFDPQGQQSRPDDDRGLGLAAMKLRAKMAGGRLVVASHPGKGSRIQIELPIMKKKARP
jgi:PAS domain S-box-containing protein